MVGYGSAEGGVGGIDRRGFRGDRDGLGLLTGRQRKIDANVLGHLEQHVGVFRRLESLGRGAHRVGAGQAGWEPYTRRLRRSSTFAWYREPRR